MELILEDILALCAGKQEDGTAMAGSSISVFGVAVNKTPLIKQEITFTQSLEIHAAGGCITVSIDFKKGPEFYRTAKICMDWLKNPKGTLIYTMIPMVLEGKISVLLQNLVYCDFYEKKNGVVRLILAFDNNETRLFGSDNIDYGQGLLMIIILNTLHMDIIKQYIFLLQIRILARVIMMYCISILTTQNLQKKIKKK